jgi:hypothetical protein|nr:BPSL0761 family protein [Rhodoferax sp.]
MTTPDERTRALVQTKQFLQGLQIQDTVPPDVREVARALLRHYPTLAHALSPGKTLLSNKERK